METLQEGWRGEAEGVLALETEALRVVLRRWPTDGYVRFLVLRQDGQADRVSAERLVASGTEESVPAAMQAAERTVARLTGRPPLAAPRAAEPPVPRRNVRYGGLHAP